jgi:endonuclease-3
MASRRRVSKPKRRATKPVATATPAQAMAIANVLATQWPSAVVELDHQNPYQLLVATILAAQSSDKQINLITPALFAKYPDATALAAADQAELEVLIHSSGFFRNKAKHLIAMAQAVVERHGGEIPRTMAELVAIPGIGRKTANVVLGSAMGIAEGIVVDLHVSRVAPRLHLTAQTDPVKIEQDLMKLLPREQWIPFAHRMIWHGRRICFPQRPDCEHCPLAPLCPSAGMSFVAPKPKPMLKPKPKLKAQKPTKAPAKRRVRA